MLHIAREDVESFERADESTKASRRDKQHYLLIRQVNLSQNEIRGRR